MITHTTDLERAQAAEIERLQDISEADANTGDLFALTTSKGGAA